VPPLGTSSAGLPQKALLLQSSGTRLRAQVPAPVHSDAPLSYRRGVASHTSHGRRAAECSSHRGLSTGSIPECVTDRQSQACCFCDAPKASVGRRERFGFCVSQAEGDTISGPIEPCLDNARVPLAACLPLPGIPGAGKPSRAPKRSLARQGSIGTDLRASAFPASFHQSRGRRPSCLLPAPRVTPRGVFVLLEV
jgi:hypothetical protein